MKSLTPIAAGLSLLAAALTPLPAAAQPPSPPIERAVAAETRSESNRARDTYRHPAETLAFFGVTPDATVIEFSPGGGWYTEILAPLLADEGRLIAAQPGAYYDRIKAKLDAEPEVYGDVHLVSVPPPEGAIMAGSADYVLTFRNVHNLVMNGQGEAAFRMFHAWLKPGGVLGVVDHRLPEDRDAADEQSSGYVKVSTVKSLAEQAGFEFVEASEINANPQDTADWPEGVWTLPPTLRLGDTDREKYQAIGESDRMTLKFRKPAS